MVPLIASIPHAGERVPPEAGWLTALPPAVLLRDVDRYVDVLYAPALRRHAIPIISTPWHRYAIDLNRLPEDVDADSVRDHPNPAGRFPRGLHWSITTFDERIMPQPITMAAHDGLVEKYYNPFHATLRVQLDATRRVAGKGIYHLDLHSMPSSGTSQHLDGGQARPDVVISDCEGRSCSKAFTDLVLAAYASAGFSVSHNWPYRGGRITQTYGQPALGVHTIQVEINRALYMDEETKELRADRIDAIQQELGRVIDTICAAIAL